MAQSAPYLRKHKNGKHYIHWTENRVGKRVTTHQTDVKEAKRLFGLWLLRDQTSASPMESAVQIGSLWPVYFEKHVLPNVSVPETVEIAWNNLKPFFGSLAVSQFTQAACDEYVTRRVRGKLGRKVKPQTCRKELAYLIACLNFCARAPQKLLDGCSIEKIRLPAEAEPRDRWLRVNEINRLFAAAGKLRKAHPYQDESRRLSRVERFLWIALHTAARRQAILDLTWDRVDFEINVIYFAVPGRRKTKKRRVAVPIADALRPVLERAFAERLDKFRFDGLVLDNGGAVWPQIQRVAVEAGLGGQRRKIPAGTKPKSTGISPHVLRHTAATHMARRGVPLWIIAKTLGNSLPVVEKTYAHHCPTDLRDAVNTISVGLELQHQIA